MQKSELEFHTIVAREVQSLEYGQMTINVQLRGGVPVLTTLNIVKSKRKRYDPSKLTRKI